MRGGEQPRAVLDVARGTERPQELRVQLDVGGGPALGVRAQPRAPLGLDPQRVADERALAVGRALVLDGIWRARSARGPASSARCRRRRAAMAATPSSTARTNAASTISSFEENHRVVAASETPASAATSRCCQPVGPDARDDGERAVDDARAGEVGGRGHRYRCTGDAPYGDRRGRRADAALAVDDPGCPRSSSPACARRWLRRGDRGVGRLRRHVQAPDETERRSSPRLQPPAPPERRSQPATGRDERRLLHDPAGAPGGPGGGPGAGETALTGDTKAKVEAAALAKVARHRHQVRDRPRRRLRGACPQERRHRGRGQGRQGLRRHRGRGRVRRAGAGTAGPGEAAGCGWTSRPSPRPSA